MAFGGVERNQELQDRSIYVDARSIERRIGDSLIRHDVMRNTMIAATVICFLYPIMIVFVIPVVVTLRSWWVGRINRFVMPIRYPEWTGVPDPSTYDKKNKTCRPAGGIEFMGTERTGRTMDRTMEIWGSDDDVRTHRVIMGTTGAGKTQTLLSILFNPLCWGSGFSMTDGKAQTDVTVNIFVMARLFWREDDVLILNYMRGGQDRFKEMIDRPETGKRKTRVSNTWNPFSSANHETINQIIDSIMEKATGDGAQWQGKAINMKNALVQTIAYLRAKGDMLMSVAAIREQMALDNMIKLAMRNDIPPAAAVAIRSYLSSGLPGFSWQKARAGKPQDSDTLLQHGYLTGQFTRTLGLMTDTYLDIFGDEIPEFDTSDVILNNRISFTMIPTLEKGVEEAGNLGKMQVASAKMMMAENLGYEIEGSYEDIVDNRPTNARRPYYLVMDELGYYFAPGIDLMFAQGRSLQIALIAAGQDFQAMAKNNKSEVESMIANTRIKISMKLEDPKETFEIFQKAAGKAAVARIDGFDSAEQGMGVASGQFNRKDNARVEEIDRISLQELKSLDPGDGVMLFSDKVIRFTSFNLFMNYKFNKKEVDIRINTFLPIPKPDFGVIMQLCKPASGETDSTGARLMAALRGGEMMWSSDADKIAKTDPVLSALVDASEQIAGAPNMTPQDKGIVLFMAAINSMDNDRQSDVDIETSGSEGGGGSYSSKPIPPIVDTDFLNNPPIVEVDREKIAMPDWGETPGDEVTFGGDEKTKEEIIDFTPSVKSDLEKAIVGLSGGKDAVTQETVDNEIERTRKLVDESCRFKDAGRGLSAEPLPVAREDDVMAILDSITMDLRQ